MKAAKPSELPLIWTFFLRDATKAAKPSELSINYFFAYKAFQTLPPGGGKEPLGSGRGAI